MEYSISVVCHVQILFVIYVVAINIVKILVINAKQEHIYITMTVMQFAQQV